jgi:hypothetical protein
MSGRSHGDDLPPIKSTPRSQSVPKRVRFADHPSVYDASPRNVFSRPLTSSAFPSNASSPPSLSVQTWQPPAAKSNRGKWLFLAIVIAMISFLTVLANSWISMARPEDVPLTLLGIPESNSQNGLIMTCALAATVLIVFLVVSRL